MDMAYLYVNGIEDAQVMMMMMTFPMKELDSARIDKLGLSAEETTYMYMYMHDYMRSQRYCTLAVPVSDGRLYHKRGGGAG